jgi:hypothetical protein
MNTKDTNPKDAIGLKKAPISVLPWRVLWRVALAFLEGTLKYRRHNYRVAGVRASVYFDACVNRHLGRWWEGEDDAPDSKLHHIDHAIACLFILRDSILTGNWTDDRPPSTIEDMQAEMDELNAGVERLLERFPDAEAPFTIADTNLVRQSVLEAQTPIYGVGWGKDSITIIQEAQNRDKHEPKSFVPSFAKGEISPSFTRGEIPTYDPALDRMGGTEVRRLLSTARVRSALAIGENPFPNTAATLTAAEVGALQSRCWHWMQTSPDGAEWLLFSPGSSNVAARQGSPKWLADLDTIRSLAHSDRDSECPICD